MQTLRSAAIFLTLVVAGFWVPAWCADPPTDVEKVQRQSTSIPDLRQSLANAVGYPVTSVGVRHTAQSITVTVISGKPDGASQGDHDPEALALASLVEAAIAGKAEYAHIGVIRLEFVSRKELVDESIATFEFIRTATSTFARLKG